MGKKWADPLDRLLEADEKATSTVNDYLKTISQKKPIKQSNENNSSMTNSSQNQTQIIELDVDKIIRWKYKDRPENELGDITELAETFKSVGQQQPCIVRASVDHKGKYELIVGERRWRAAELARIKLKVIIQDYDDKTAALIQAVENERRSDISDYAKGMSYADKIEKGLITQSDLIEILHISKQQVSRLLSFKKIPASLFEAISDFRKVSARTAEELSRLSAKGQKYIDALIDLAPKIRTGKFGEKRIKKEIEKKIKIPEDTVKSNRKVFNNDGRHLFTWRKDNNGAPSIHFPKDIIQLLNEERISFDQLTTEIKECIAEKLADLKN